MKLTYKSDIRINSAREDLLALLAQDRFGQKYFPEIRKQPNELSKYVVETHNNLREVLPSYVAPCFGMGWSDEAGIVFEVPNKALGIDIRAVEIEHVHQKAKSTLSIEIAFDIELNLRGLFAAYHVRQMVKSRLNAIKRDVEAGSGAGRNHSLVQCGLEY